MPTPLPVSYPLYVHGVSYREGCKCNICCVSQGISYREGGGGGYCVPSPCQVWQTHRGYRTSERGVHMCTPSLPARYSVCPLCTAHCLRTGDTEDIQVCLRPITYLQCVPYREERVQTEFVLIQPTHASSPGRWSHVHGGYHTGRGERISPSLHCYIHTPLPDSYVLYAQCGEVCICRPLAW